VAAKKRFKLAVTRNKVKRYLREQFRLNQARLSGLDIVIIPRAQSVFDVDFINLFDLIAKKSRKLC